MRKIIPLSGGSINAAQVFDVLLGETYATFNVNWRTLYGYWSVSISVEGVEIVSGASLEVNADIIAHWRLGEVLGQLLFVGDEATLDNLGSSNKLVWVSNE